MTEELWKKGYRMVLITSKFPFGSGEPFLMHELPHLQKEFGEIVIISQDSKSKALSEIPERVKVYRYNTATDIKGFIYMPLLLLLNLRCIITLYKGETGFRKAGSFRLSFANRLFLAKKIIKAIQLRGFIHKVLKQEELPEKVILYSYWLNTGAHAIALTNITGSVKIARAHGSDLYEDRSPAKYLPLMNFCAKSLNSIFFISEDGRRYFTSRFPGAIALLSVSRLGVQLAANLPPPSSEKNIITIATCSNIIPLKRIDLVIRSLELVRSERFIRWIHFGDGPLRGAMEELASQVLGPKDNITYEFRGQVPNAEILRFYSENHINLFLNVSTTEGLPVSIMEAQFFGIPAIATDVGGVREIVTDETGILVSSDITPGMLAETIGSFIGKSAYETGRLRENCLNYSKKNFSAAENYSGFISRVNSILASDQTDSRS